MGFADRFRPFRIPHSDFELRIDTRRAATINSPRDTHSMPSLESGGAHS